MEPTQKFLTSAEVAPILRITIGAVVGLCRSGKLPATKPAGTWLIGENDLHKFIAAGSNQQTAAVS